MLEKIGIELIDDSKRWYKLYSIWFFALIAMAPDIYNLVAMSGIFPPEQTPAVIDKVIKITALAGAILRLVKQKVATDQAAAGLAEEKPPGGG